jgi:2',3'-cyclic-nucleotide 2'-phosphodiesterase (5'-nucleotidase family)
VTASNGTELKALGKAGYDAVNLGYNEFNLGSNALRQMILRGKNAQTKTSATTTTTTTSSTATGTTAANTNTTGMPYIVGPGVNWDKSSGTSASRLKRILRTYGAASYKIIEKEDTKVAVFGLMDEEALNEASNGGVTFSDYLDYAKGVMSKIKKKKPDMIVCLVNCGKDETAKDGAAGLAKDLSDVDVMITSGTGEKLTEAVTEGNTTIVSAGTRGQYLGQLLMKKKSGSYVVKKYKLAAIQADTSSDSTVQSVVNSGISKINGAVFRNSGFSYNTSLGTNSYTFHTAAQMGSNAGEDKLGDLLADSFAYTAKRAGTDADVAFIARGEITDTLYKGSLKTADIYNAMCTGGSMSEPKGYDLVSFYLKGSELRNLAEIDASVANDTPKARLFFSGLSYTVNEHRLKLNRATDVKLVNRNGETSQIKSGKLYLVVCDTYFTGIMDDIMSKGHSMLQITPKDAGGNELAAGKYLAVRNGTRSVKNWYAVSKYIKSRGGVPAYYSKTHNRKILSNSLSPVALFKQANSFARIVYAVVLIPIVVIIGLLLFFRQRKNRRRGYSSSMFGSGRGRTKRYKSKFR